MCDGADTGRGPVLAGVASSGGPVWAPSAPEGAPEVFGVWVQCSSARAVSCAVKA